MVVGWRKMGHCTQFWVEDIARICEVWVRKKEELAYESFDRARLCDYVVVDAFVSVKLSITVRTSNHIDLPNITQTRPWDQIVLR